MPHIARLITMIVLAWVAAWAQPAVAVVVYGGSDAVNGVAPLNDSGWNNVVYLNNASAVYLGNRWLLTANHVTDGPVRTSDGRSFSITIGGDKALSNPGDAASLGAPDLRLVRLSSDPGLPSMPIATKTPANNSEVMMIGAGLDQGPNLVGWHVTADSTGGADWEPAALNKANILGYNLLSTAHMHWGMNQVNPDSVVFASSNTFVFSTTFNRPGTPSGTPYEAQAAVGDSGGGVFQQVNGQWQLVGLMDAVRGATDQPSNASVISNITFSVDLAQYRDQIMSIVNAQDSAWQNQVNHYDANHSGKTTPQDFLVIINELARNGSRALTGSPTGSDALYDVNGDGMITPADAGAVGFALLEGVGNGVIPASAAASGMTLVPEPASGLLAAIGLGALMVGARIARARRLRSARV